MLHITGIWDTPEKDRSGRRRANRTKRRTQREHRKEAAAAAEEPRRLFSETHSVNLRWTGGGLPPWER